jgi:hypothetical protein
MDPLKYVVTETGSFAIFSPSSSHRDVARDLYGRAVGAGFCRLTCEIGEKISIQVWGYSASLDLESRKVEDVEIMERKINSEF